MSRLEEHLQFHLDRLIKKNEEMAARIAAHDFLEVTDDPDVRDLAQGRITLDEFKAKP